MALDFPTSPTNGQQFTSPDGVIWSWDGAKWISASPGTTIGYGNVGRNLIHNSMFNVVQRGYGPWTAGGYTADRWTVGSLVPSTFSTSIGSINDAQRAAIGDEYAWSSLTTSFAGNAAVGAATVSGQAIENVARLANKTVILSFWAWTASGTLNLGASIDQSFGTGGSPSTPARGNGQKIVATTTPTRYMMTFVVGSLAGKSFGTNGDTGTYLNFWYSAEASFNIRSGSVGVQSGAIALWGVQLEIGSVATPLEKPDPQVDLANCQRFYQTGYLFLQGYQGAGAGFNTSTQFATVMRAVPTVAGTNSGSNIAGFSLAALGVTGLYNLGTAAVAGTCLVQCNFTASADL